MLKRNPIDTYCDKKIPTLQKAYDGLIDYIDISSVDNTEKKIVSFQTLAAKDAPSRAKQLLKKGDILVSTVRPNLNAVAIVEEETENLMVGSTGYCVLRCNGTMDNRYLFNFCQSQYFIDDMTSQATGASYPAVSNGIVRNSLIPVYPIEQQREIADRLDTVSNLIALRKQQLSELDNLVKSRFIELFGDLASSTCPWETKALVDTCLSNDDIKCGPFGTQLSKDEYTSSGVAVWEIPQINNKFTTHPTHYLTSEKADQLSAYSIIPGDIAMSRKGNVGKCAVFPADYPNGIIHSDVLRIRVDSTKVLPIFMMYQLHFSRAVQYQIECVSSGAIMAGINVTKLKNILVHIPPIMLQSEFAAFVKHTDKLKLAVTEALTEQETLKKSLMQQYFG